MDRPRLGDLSGAAADLGVFVPLVAALIAVNGLGARPVLLSAGLLVLCSGAVFRIPFPVQPLKALAAVAVAHRLGPDVIHAAGLEIAVVLLVLSLPRVADRVARVFTTPVVGALQLGVGALVIVTAIRLAVRPPGFAPAGASHALMGLHVPGPRAFATAFWLLVVPQLALTFGNAVVGVTDVAHRYFGDRAARVTPSRVCLSCGVGNLVSGLVGGIPMCHGAGGLTAHYRLGARTVAMNLVLGSSFVAAGLLLRVQTMTILTRLPMPVLAMPLAYAGVRHLWLVADLHRSDLAIAVVAGAAGALAGNLTLTVAIALVAEHGLRRVARVSVARAAAR